MLVLRRKKQANRVDTIYYCCYTTGGYAGYANSYNTKEFEVKRLFDIFCRDCVGISCLH